MKKVFLFIFIFTFSLVFPLTTHAHFGMVIPTKSTVMEAKDTKVDFVLKFWHPFENVGMSLEKPASFVVYHNSTKTDLGSTLSPAKEQNHAIWKTSYIIPKPGVYAFVMTPTPYYEPAEDCFIIHQTKVYVDAFGDDENWDVPLGLEAEIVPLINPNKLYAGNTFQGQVLYKGKPVPHALVEVEWFSGEAQKGIAPHESMVTQSVKANSSGIFSYTAPKEGWWGFAALITAENTLPFKGSEKEIEMGAVLWMHFYKMLSPAPLK